MKTCGKCGISKPLNGFYYDKRRGKVCSPCRACCINTQLVRKRIYRGANPLIRRTTTETRQTSINTRLKSMYGFKLGEFDALLTSQNGCCAICQQKIDMAADTKKFRPHIDHNHDTGEIRGLLCLTCNTGLGMFSDSTDLLDAAKNYLLRPRPAIAL